MQFAIKVYVIWVGWGPSPTTGPVHVAADPQVVLIHELDRIT